MHQETIQTEHTADDETTFDRDKLIAALPDVVDESMRKAIPHLYTPEKAAEFTAAMTAELRRPTDDTTTDSAREHTARAACPSFCNGDPDRHGDPREYIHYGPERSLNGSYMPNGSSVSFCLAQWHDGAPYLTFEVDGICEELGLPGVDELIGDAVPWLAQLIAARRRLAIEVSPNRSTVPFTESEDKQTASAAFDLATAAIDVALAKTEDRAGTLRALRTFLAMTEAEQAGEDR